MSTPVGPYSPLVRAGDMLACSGQIGIDKSGRLVPGGVKAQVTQAIANMAAVLRQGGAELSDVVKTTVFLTHMSDYGDMNEAYSEAFGGHRPARSAVAVSGLPLGAMVEVEAWAYLPGR